MISASSFTRPRSMAPVTGNALIQGMRPNRKRRGAMGSGGMDRRRGADCRAFRLVVELLPYRLVEAVPLNRPLSGAPDQLHQRPGGHVHLGPGAGLVVDPLVHHGPLHVVAPEGERDLREEWRDHGP